MTDKPYFRSSIMTEALLPECLLPHGVMCLLCMHAVLRMLIQYCMYVLQRHHEYREHGPHSNHRSVRHGKLLSVCTAYGVLHYWGVR